MSSCLIRNLLNTPCDYPKSDGSSVYLGSKGRASGIVHLQEGDISKAMREAERKGILVIEEIKESEVAE